MAEPYVPTESEAQVDVAEQIQRAIRSLTIATVILFVVLGGAVYWFANESAKAHNALCAYRNQQESQVQQSKDFLIEHPNGIPGIPKKLLLDGIRQNETIVKALDELNC